MVHTVCPACGTFTKTWHETHCCIACGKGLHCHGKKCHRVVPYQMRAMPAEAPHPLPIATLPLPPVFETSLPPNLRAIIFARAAAMSACGYVNFGAMAF